MDVVRDAANGRRVREVQGKKSLGARVEKKGVGAVF